MQRHLEAWLGHRTTRARHWANAGPHADMYVYRDRHGVEADLLLPWNAIPPADWA